MSKINASSFFAKGTQHIAGQSLRFEDGDSPYFSFTFGTPTNQIKWTMSFWCKRGEIGREHAIYGAANGGGETFFVAFYPDDIEAYISTGRNHVTNAVFRDPSAWYHIVQVFDSANATADDRFITYVNGVRQATSTNSVALNDTTAWNTSGVTGYFGKNYGAWFGDSRDYFDGYLANVTFIDGQALTPTSFGEYDGTLWKPKSDADITGNLTFGTNGFYLNFEDSSAIGDDTSGNANDLTANNLVATDVVLDAPVTGGNFTTLNTVDKNSSAVISEGNLEIGVNSNIWYHQARATMFVDSGKWYWEVYQVGTGGFWKIGIRDNAAALSSNTASSTGFEYYAADGNKHSSSGAAAYSSETSSQGKIFAFALDMDAGTITLYVNNVSQGVMFSGLTGYYAPTCSMYNSTIMFNFGQDSSFSGNATPQGNTDDNGVGDFYYAPPSGFLALNTGNLPTPAITAPDEYFNTVLYAGDDTTSNAITGVGFQPDFTWIKGRNTSVLSHGLFDSVRGANKTLFSDGAYVENSAVVFPSFDSDGFTVSDAGGNWTNDSFNYVAWNWLAGNGTVSNTSGSITSQVSANTDAGFSVVSYTGTGSAATVGHGLSSAPEMVIVKSRSLASSWPIYHTGLTSASYRVFLDLNNAQGSSLEWNSTDPTSSVFSIGPTGYSVNNSGATYIAYCFHSVEGYSKIGTYESNNSTNGPYVHLGFKPAWILMKDADRSAMAWVMFDNKRGPINPNDESLNPSTTSAEPYDSNSDIDFLSNGFKLRGGSSSWNNYLTETYIYIAFAEAPFKSANAR
jgi:hypothetical protein